MVRRSTICTPTTAYSGSGAAPAAWTDSNSHTQLFLGSNAKFFKVDVTSQTYKFGATTKVSGVAYDKGSAAYMVSTADATNKDGKLIYIDAMTDPTPGSN